jgi:hypothetical protein
VAVSKQEPSAAPEVEECPAPASAPAPAQKMEVGMARGLAGYIPFPNNHYFLLLLLFLIFCSDKSFAITNVPFLFYYLTFCLFII